MTKMTIENATVTATVDGVRYVHDFVTSISINDPRENALSVAPQGEGDGVVFRTGTTSSITLDMIVRNMPIEMAGLYMELFGTQERVDFMIVNSATGERFDLNNSILRTNPSNVSITEGEGSLDVAINASCPPNGFSHTPV